jgi:hypothetical protein
MLAQVPLSGARVLVVDDQLDATALRHECERARAVGFQVDLPVQSRRGIASGLL